MRAPAVPIAETICRAWAETAALFERSGFPQDTYDTLDEDEYIQSPQLMQMRAAPPHRVYG